MWKESILLFFYLSKDFDRFRDSIDRIYDLFSFRHAIILTEARNRS